MITRIAKLLSLLLLLAAGTAQAFDETAVGWVGDLPVPAHALIDTKGAVNFDAPAGRVIAFTFQSAYDAPALSAFYEATLTPLGWQKGGALYQRGSEVMMIVPSTPTGEMPFAYRLVVKPAGN